MNVLVIPEDPMLDEHILVPVLAQVFRDLGRAARVRVLKEPRLRGVDEELDAGVVAGIVRDKPTTSRTR